MHVSVNCVLLDYSNYPSNICVISKNLNGLQSFKIHYFNYTPTTTTTTTGAQFEVLRHI